MESVSIVVPCYKSEKLVGRTVSSLVSAGVPGGNIYVVEDGVYDNTGQILKNYLDVNHICYEKNKGAPYARNIGLARVATKYVMFVDSDDFVSPGLIKGLVEAANKNVSDLALGPWRFDGETRKSKAIRHPSKLPAKNWVTHWLIEEFVPPCSILWSTDFVKKIGGWDERLKQNQDGDIAIRAFMKARNVAYSEKGYSTYWQHDSDDRVSNAKDVLREKAADVVYSNVFRWLEKNKVGADDQVNVARYCVAQAWRSLEFNGDSYNKWFERAESLGFYDKGYSKKTKLLYRVFGLNAAVYIKRKKDSLRKFRFHSKPHKT